MTDTASGAPAAAPGPEMYDPTDSTNRCYLCGAPDYRLLYEVRHFGFPFRFQRCRCGLVKQTPMPNAAFFAWFFNSEIFFSGKKHGAGKVWGFYDYFSDEPSRLATSRLRYRRLARLFPRRDGPLEVLKIGPATGTFLKVAQDHGQRARGVDVSSRFVDYARRTYGVEIDHGRFEEMGYADGAFDIILLLNVIENVPNQVEFLNEIRRCLAPDGLFVFNFVDMKRNLLAALQRDRYFIYRPPICYVFDCDVMRRVMARFGFEVVAEHRDLRFMTAEKIATLLGWRWLHRLVRALRLHKLPFPVYAYPSRIWVARRTAD